MAIYTVQLTTTTTAPNGTNIRPLVTVVQVNASNEVNAHEKALAVFDINFPYSGESVLTYNDIQVNPPK